jgi:predicted nucleotidyltransferase component of viral defense system
MAEPKRNMGASVRVRLLKLANERGQPNELLLTSYALERLLYRLSTSTHRNRFVLKGAMLMTTWFDTPFRPTRDLDFLGFGDSEPEKVLAVFREIAASQRMTGSSSTWTLWKSSIFGKSSNMAVFASRVLRLSAAHASVS